MREKTVYTLGALGTLLLIWNFYTIFVRIPIDALQGDIFRIIFVHVPAAMTAFTFYGVAVFASIAFLVTKNFAWDSMAVSAVEVGTMFTLVNLATGSIWARVIWGIWWAWDARLTSALVCWILYASYLMLRRAIDEPTQRATFSAVFSIFCFIDVPIVIFSIKWWRTQHPQPVFWGGGSIPGGWYAIALWQLLAMVLLGAVLTIIRLRDEESQREIESIRRMAHSF